MKLTYDECVALIRAAYEPGYCTHTACSLCILSVTNVQLIPDRTSICSYMYYLWCKHLTDENAAAMFVHRYSELFPPELITEALL